MRPTGRVGPLLASLAVIAGLATGCATVGVAETPTTCPDALLGPVTLLLAEDGRSTVAMTDGAVAVPLRWPPGYGLRPDANGGDIVNERGEAVARVGNVVWLGGGFANDDKAFEVCGDVMREDPTVR